MARTPFPFDRPDRKNELDLRRDRLPQVPQHPIREIDKIMDDIVYNAIDYIQENNDRSDLRTFYFNLISDRNWENRDFEELVELLGFFIDYCLDSGKARDTREALSVKLEQFIQLHMASVGEQFPDVTRDLGEREYRDMKNAADMYDELKRGLMKQSRDGGRRDRGGRYDGDRSRNRRDTYDRDAIQGSRRGSPSNQSDRFDDGDSSRTSRDDRNDRDDRSDRRSDRNDDRYGDSSERKEQPRQRMPYNEPAPDANDRALDDAFGPQSLTETPMQNNEIINTADGHLQLWVPSKEHPHPPAFNYDQVLMFGIDVNTAAVRPFLKKAEGTVNYEEHKTLAFGNRPRDYGRFSDISNPKDRAEELRSAVIGDDVPVTIKGEDGPKLVSLKRRLDIVEPRLAGTNLSDIFIQLEAARLAQEADNLEQGQVKQNVEIATAQGLLVKPMLFTAEERLLVDDLISVRSFQKLSEKLRSYHRTFSLSTFLTLDGMIAREVNRILAQRLSIPKVSITSLTGDWQDLYQYLSEAFGESYRDLLQDFQEYELAALFNQDAYGDLHAENLIGRDGGVKVTAFSTPVKVILVREAAGNLNLDLMPGVASELMEENVPFFYDLAKDVLKEPGAAKRFFVQTQDRHVFELSGSYVNPDALLVRKIA